MCVKYKIVSVLYVWFIIDNSLLYITFFCSFNLYKYILLHAKIAKSRGFKTRPSFCKAELFLNTYLSRHF